MTTLFFSCSLSPGFDYGFVSDVSSHCLRVGLASRYISSPFEVLFGYGKILYENVFYVTIILSRVYSDLSPVSFVFLMKGFILSVFFFRLASYAVANSSGFRHCPSFTPPRPYYWLPSCVGSPTGADIASLTPLLFYRLATRSVL